MMKETAHTPLPNLDLAISTWRKEGIIRLSEADLPRIYGVNYIVSWQAHEGFPIPEQLATRDDVSIYRFDGTGQSANRNNALKYCKSDIILVGDDDIRYDSEGIDTLRQYFAENPHVHLTTTIVDRPGGPNYPIRETVLAKKLPQGYWCGCYEIALRRRSLGNMCFNTMLGLNSPQGLCACEDEMFLLTARRRRLECRFVPIHIGTHPGASTGTGKNLTPEVMRAQGCYVRAEYRFTWPLRLPLKAWRIWRKSQAKPWTSLTSLLSGAMMCRRVMRFNRRQTES